MKILMVAIPNHHFFQWVNQLEHAGYDVHWFDITDGAGFSPKISWVKQYNGWKLKWDFPFRTRLKQHLPKLYTFLQQFNENKIETVFENLIKTINPDVIHVFEMQLAGLPIFPVLQKHTAIQIIYSSWGSDLFEYKRLGLTTTFVQDFLKRTNYLITDCQRDYKIAQKLGFSSTFLGVYPGNGGISFIEDNILPQNQRKYILVKGYEDGVGKAITVLKAFQHNLFHFFVDFELVIYSADQKVIDFVSSSKFYQEFSPLILPRNEYVSNEKILNYMGNAVLHIANSSSDGMPNVLLEAMGMGAFPIQSNPGQVTEEVIFHGKNGFLILDFTNEEEIASLIKEALNNIGLREEAQNYNVDFMKVNYDRKKLQSKIVALYAKFNN